MRKLFMSLAVLICAFVIGCQTTQPAMRKLGAVATPTGTTGYRQVYTNAFNTTGTYTWKASSTTPSIRSIEMTYGTGVTNVNTFTLNYTRSGILRELLTVSGTMHTLTWYVPSEFYPVEGDVWSWSNSAAGSAMLTINCDYQY